MSVIQIEEKDFFEKTKKGKVLVDCYADWCGPCRMLSPIIDELSDEVNDCLFYKLNVDNAEKVTDKYQIMSIPTVLFFNDGELKMTIVGLRSKDDFKELLEKI